MKIHALLLAGGEGRRFGGDKLIKAQLNDIPLGLVTAATFRQVLPICIVVRKGAIPLQAIYEDAGYDVVIAEHADQGMGNSLSAGLKRVSSSGAAACLVGLADMPLVKPATLTLLCENLQQGSGIVRPMHNGRVGHPVGFSKAHFSLLTQLTEDKGARDYLEQHKAEIDYIDVDDEGILIDVDTPEDLAKVKQKLEA